MRRLLGALGVALLGLALLAGLATGAAGEGQSSAAAPAAADELIAGHDYAAWFQGYTRQAAGPDFGLYAAAAVSDTLYLGFGKGKAADLDGSLFASTDGITLTEAYSLSEQGFIGMVVVTDTIYIPGPDPTYADGWEFGNVYTYTAGTAPHKSRTLTNTIHTWGLWYEASNSSLYASVGAGVRPTTTWHYFGQVFRSDAGAATWTPLAADDEVGQYRTYDVIGHGGRLYVTWNDVYGQPCGLAESSDGGLTWTRLAALTGLTACRTRLASWNGLLLALNVAQTGLYAIDATDAITEYLFSGFQVTDWAYNYLAPAAEGYLYAVANHGRIVRTADLATWETLASTDRVFITIGYWPAKNWLIVGDRGVDARIWRLDLAASTAITIPQVPTATIRYEGGNLALDWLDVTEDVAGGPVSLTGYRVYRSTDPYFDTTSYTARRIASPTASTLTDDGIGGAQVVGDVDHNYFYLIRAEDTAGALSVPSAQLGEFDFALVLGG